MGAVVLASSTNTEGVDRVLHLIVNRFEDELPGLFRGYYIVGSYATGTAVATSDLDLVVEGGNPTSAQHARIASILDTCRGTTAINVGLFPLSGEALHGIFNPVFKLRSLFLYGHDIRSSLPLAPVAEWAWQCMHGIYRVLGRHDRLTVLVPPLEYPDPQGDFYGYDQETVRLPNGSAVRGTRGLVTGAGWMATALTGLQAHQYVLGKSEFVALYRQHVNDAWTPFLADLDNTCRRQWGYLIPSTAKDRSKLRALCGQHLGFERHFLSTYRDFALAALGGANEAACLQALRALRDLPYQDNDIKAALLLLCSHHSERLGDAAKEALQALGKGY